MRVYTDEKKYRYLICLVIFLSYLLVYFHRVCPSVIALDMQRAFGVGGMLLAILGSAYFYPYALMQLPIGLLVDSWGPRKTVSSFLAVAALGSGLMGITGNISWAIIGRVLVGVGVSTLFVANFKLLTEWFSPRQMAVMGGLFMAVGGIGVLAASTPLACVSNHLGWNWTLAAVGGLTLIMAVAVYLVVRDRPSEMGWPNMRATTDNPERATLRQLLQGIATVGTSKRFWPLAIWVGWSNGMVFALGSMWSVPYLQHVYHLSKTEASAYQTMFGVALIIGSPILGVLANYVGRKPIIVGSSVLLMVVFGMLSLFPAHLPPIGIYVVFFCLFLGGTATGPISAIVAKELFDPAIAGTSVGVVNCFPFFGGGLFQIVMGAILDHGGQVNGVYSSTSYQHMFAFCFWGVAMSFGASLFVRETLFASKTARSNR